MKTAVYILLFANLAYLVWAGLIDTPARGSAEYSSGGLPQLVLATEARAENQNATSGLQSAASVARCVSVGPFNGLERAADASALLRDRGFKPQQREEEGETGDGYWVYVGGLRSAADERRVLRILDQAALYDARVMPESDAGRRISVGLFSERIRAERRARVLRRLGLEPEIGERRVPGTVYWLDVDLGPGHSTFSAEDLLSPEEIGVKLEVRACQAVQSASALR